MLSLGQFKLESSFKHIAILDNCSISFLQDLDRKGIATYRLFQTYDCVVIPSWIKNEFVGSAITEQYLQSLIANGVLLLEANEIDYADLIPSIKAERMILDLFFAGSNLFSQVLAYLHKNVKKYDPLDLDDSHEWINALYDNWPMTNGSIKKNAGEVSITILANILSLFYPKLETITVFAQDRDTFAAHNKAVEIIQSCYGHIPMQNTPVSFKSNDFLFKQLYSAGLIDKSTIGLIRDSERTVMYSITQSDGSIVSLNRKISKDDFNSLLDSPGFSIVF